VPRLLALFEEGPFPGHRNFETRAKELPHLHGELIGKHKIFHLARYPNERGAMETKIIDGAGRLEAIRLGLARIGGDPSVVAICHDCQDFGEATFVYNSCD